MGRMQLFLETSSLIRGFVEDNVHHGFTFKFVPRFCLDSGVNAVTCRGLVMPRPTAWLYAPLPNSSTVLSSGVWWSLLLDIRSLWRHNMTLYSYLQNNVLAKFVDTTTCIFRDPGVAVGQGGGGAVKEFRAMETYKQQKNRYQLCLFLFINNVDLKNITEIMKIILNFLGTWMAGINLFQVDLDKPWNY